MRQLPKRKRLLLNWLGLSILAIAVLSWLALVASARKDPAATDADGSVAGLTSVLSREVESQMLQFRFDEVSQAAGIDFQHFPATRQASAS